MTLTPSEVGRKRWLFVRHPFRNVLSQLRVLRFGLLQDVQVGVFAERRAYPRSVRDADALHQIIEFWVVAQAVEQRMNLEIPQEGGVLLKCLFQPRESRILFAETRVDRCEQRSRGV
jgi:hypothetical protein